MFSNNAYSILQWKGFFSLSLSILKHNHSVVIHVCILIVFFFNLLFPVCYKKNPSDLSPSLKRKKKNSQSICFSYNLFAMPKKNSVYIVHEHAFVSFKKCLHLILHLSKFLDWTFTIYSCVRLHSKYIYIYNMYVSLSMCVLFSEPIESKT